MLRSKPIKSLRAIMVTALEIAFRLTVLKKKTILGHWNTPRPRCIIESQNAVTSYSLIHGLNGNFVRPKHTNVSTTLIGQIRYD